MVNKINGLRMSVYRHPEFHTVEQSITKIHNLFKLEFGRLLLDVRIHIYQNMVFLNHF